MNNQDRFLFKMSEKNILNEYTRYLQQAFVQIELNSLDELPKQVKLLLSYDEFKDYYTKTLIGKEGFVDNLVRRMQFA